MSRGSVAPCTRWLCTLVGNFACFGLVLGPWGAGFAPSEGGMGGPICSPSEKWTCLRRLVCGLAVLGWSRLVRLSFSLINFVACSQVLFSIVCCCTV